MKAKRHRFFKYNKEADTYKFMGWLIYKFGHEDELDWDNMTRKQADIILEHTIKNSYITENNINTYRKFEAKNGDLYLVTTKEFGKYVEEIINKNK